MDKKSILKNVTLLKDLPSSDLAYLEKIAKEKKIAKNEDIFAKDSSGDNLYIVISGRIKIYACSPSGKIKTLAYLDGNDFFGEMALLEQQSRSASARALENSEVLVINRNDFRKLLLNNPSLSLNFLKVVCNRLRSADKEIESLTFQNLFGRIIIIILRLAEKYGHATSAGTRISMEISHHDLAQLAGTAREMVTRILNRLKRIGCITYDDNDRRLTIVNLNKMKELIYY